MNRPSTPAVPPEPPDPNVRHDIGGWISGPCLPGHAFHVLITAGDDVTSYVVRADDELTAAAIAGAEHGGSIEDASVEPWTAQ